MLKPQDIVLILKILSTMTLSKGPHEVLSQNQLAVLLCMSVSEVNAGTKRLILSKLVGPSFDVKNRLVLLPIRAACEECLVHGVKYFCPPRMGGYSRGIATSYAAPIFEECIVPGKDPIPVWPYAEGDKRGIALEPLYRSVPQSVMQYPDPLFYDLLVLIDAVRAGQNRERNIAVKLLKERINGGSEAQARNI